MAKNQDDHKRSFAQSLKARVAAVMVLVLLFCMAGTAASATIYTVDVAADGKTQTVKTSARKADGVIEKAGIALGTKDKIDDSKFHAGTSSEQGNALKVYRAYKVRIQDGTDTIARLTVAGTVQDVLDTAKVTLSPKDKLSYPKDKEITEDTTIEIIRSDSIRICADGKTQYVAYEEGTVADVLDRQGITLGRHDEVEPSLDTVLKGGETITVKRISFSTHTTTETIPYKTIIKSSPLLKIGTSRVLVEGQDGTRAVVYKDKFVNGKVESSDELSAITLLEPINQVEINGTKINLKKASDTSSISDFELPSHYHLYNGVPTDVKATITGPATAYTAPAKALCATGVYAQPGYVAVDPREIPYGSELYIVSADGKQVYGYCIAADTGGFIYNSNTVVDLYMNTENQCVQWGRRDVIIYVLSWGNWKH